MTERDYEALYKTLTRRYGHLEPETLIQVLCPLNLAIKTLDKTVMRVPGQTHWRGTFTIALNDENRGALAVGRTGKFVPYDHVHGDAPWRELAKGRIIAIDEGLRVAHGEVYVGDSSKASLSTAIESLADADYLEIDQFGAAAKVLSALTESSLAHSLAENGYVVRRMPEDTARHLGAYYNYDFEATRGGVTKKIEVKSLWGTDTRFARLIHSKTTGYDTSSCKFATQDFFAVSLFLRTGNVEDFAFARSVASDVASYGLPKVPAHPAHVTQNPVVTIGDGKWFSSLDEVWDLP